MEQQKLTTTQNVAQMKRVGEVSSAAVCGGSNNKNS
jgi:hypothetical protein